MLETITRKTLWISSGFNLIAAYALAFPQNSLGVLFELPSDTSRLYAYLFSYVVAVFGVSYAWLARQPTISKPLLSVAAAGKIGIFMITAALTMTGDISIRPTLLASGDLLFGSIWLSWLLQRQH